MTSQPQHIKALTRANEVRLKRAERKREVGRGDAKVSDLIEKCPWELESCGLAELLTSQRRWGLTRARKFLMPLALSESKTVGSLTWRQRNILANSLKEKDL